MKRLIKFFIVLSPILVFLSVWGISLGKCELLTLMHSTEFSELYQVNTVIGEQKYLKVLEYSNSHARVYYVGKDNSMANVLSFVRQEKQWKYDKWERCVWSTSGNADSVIWPYWWHFIYYSGF